MNILRELNFITSILDYNEDYKLETGKWNLDNNIHKIKEK